MTQQVITVDHLKHQVLPDLFRDPSRISEYGNTEGAGKSIDQLGALMQRGSMGALTKQLSQILTKMADASPERISKEPNFWERMFGGGLEKQVRYQVARKTLDEMIATAEGQAQAVRDTISKLSELIESHATDVQAIQTYIRAGREFLEENPTVGEPQGDGMEFDRPRERLARKIANLAALLASHELSINQMKLTRAQAIDMLDRVNETVDVLVPVWRQHSLTLITTKHMSPSLVAEASRAHKALMASLSSSLEGITQD